LSSCCSAIEDGANPNTWAVLLPISFMTDAPTLVAGAAPGLLMISQFTDGTRRMVQRPAAIARNENLAEFVHGGRFGLRTEVSALR